jgi:hypothetical protein
VRFAEALQDGLLETSGANWRSKLAALRNVSGSWAKTAQLLGIHRRTLERWRSGKTSRPDLGKVQGALAGDRRAQVRAVDWRTMRVTAKIRVEDTYDRDQTMNIGLYLSPEAIAGIAAAYVGGDDDQVDRAANNALGSDYIPNGDTRFLNVQSVTFG